MENTQQMLKPLDSKILWGLRTFNKMGQLLGSFGIRMGNADADTIIRKAKRKSGINTIVDDSFREPLDVLIESANQQSNLNSLGRFVLQELITQRVSNHLQIDATLAAHPDILEQPVKRPIFIAALPRTGTTFLHRLFAQDTALRIPLHWEMDHPCPPPEEKNYATDPRIRVVEQELALFNRFAPKLKAIHELGACLPEECIYLFANDLISDFFVTGFDLPGYRQWLREKNLHYLYERHKKQLQLLQYRYRKDRWVLKSPVHLRGLRSLMQVYPDACIIQTHRDPTEIIASSASLVTATWSIFHNKILPEMVGRIVLDLVGFWIDQGMADREQAEANLDSQVQFIDVYYKDLVTNPIGTISGFYDRCGLSWSPSIERQMTTFYKENHLHKHGKHHYSLEQFGLKEEQVHERFAAYNERFLG